MLYALYRVLTLLSWLFICLLEYCSVWLQRTVFLRESNDKSRVAFFYLVIHVPHIRIKLLYIYTCGSVTCIYCNCRIYYYAVYVGRKDTDPPHVAGMCACTPLHLWLGWCICLFVTEIKREIAIWERTARLLPIVSLEERAVREALRTKAKEVRLQLKEARTLTWVCHSLSVAQISESYKQKYQFKYT